MEGTTGVGIDIDVETVIRLAVDVVTGVGAD